MKIGFDIQTLQTFEKKRGIGIVAQNILREISYMNKTRRIVLITNANLSLPDLSFLKPQEYEIYQIKDSADFKKLFDFVDTYFMTSPLMPDILFPANETVPNFSFAYVHDLIPLQQKEIYLDRWNPDERKEYLRRVEYISNNSTGIFCNSKYTAEVISKTIKYEAEKIHVAYPGISREFQECVESCPSNFPQDMKYLFYLGGENPRKNNEGLIQAFAEMNASERNGNKLVLAGNFPEPYQEKLISNLPEGDRENFFILNSPTDAEIKYLYNHATLTVFPSKSEGFGIPIIESLAMRTPVIGGNNTSIKEILSEDLLFDAENIDAIKDSIIKNINLKSNTSENDQIFNIENYSFKTSAETILQKMDEMILDQISRFSPERKKIAWFAPHPSSRSGISFFSQKVIEHLNQYYEVSWFIDSTDFKNYPSDEYFDEKNFKPEEFSTVIFNIGNHQCNKFSYENAKKYSGVVIQHDLFIDDFIRYIYKDDPSSFENEIAESRKFSLETGEYLFANGMLANAKKVITLNDWSRTQILKFFPEKDVYALSHPSNARTWKQNYQKDQSKVDLFQSSSTFVLGAFGYVTPHKRITSLVHAIAPLFKSNDQMRLLLVGEVMDEEVINLIEEYGIKDQVKITGFADQELYEKCLSACDLNINLRFPTMGETSGPLIEALDSAIPCIVTDINQFQEFPDSCVWKVENDEYEIKVLNAYISYCSTHPEVLSVMSKCAEEFSRITLSHELFAYKFYTYTNGK